MIVDYICANLSLSFKPTLLLFKGCIVDFDGCTVKNGDSAMCSDSSGNEIWIEVTNAAGRTIEGQIYENGGSAVVHIGEKVRIDHKYIVEIYHARKY